MDEINQYCVPFIDFTIKEKNTNEFVLYSLKDTQNKQVAYEININKNNFDHTIWKSLINKIKDVYIELHAKVNKIDAKKDLIGLCLEANRQYIRLVENELELIRTSEDAKENDELTQIRDTLSILLKIWKLSEIIFLKSSSSTSLSFDLQEWYKQTNNLDKLIQKVFNSSNDKTMMGIHMDNDYWPCIIACILQGRIDTARHLLAQNQTRKQTLVYRQVDDLLKKMPSLHLINQMSTLEFRARWEHWQKECLSLMINTNFQEEEEEEMDNKELEIILKILCANEETFVELKDIFFNNWYYMLISYATYSNPTFNISDLSLLIQKFIQAYGERVDVLDTCVYYIFDFDLINLCKHVTQLNASYLIFNAHFIDLLYLNGKFEDTHVLKEYLYEYGWCLLTTAIDTNINQNREYIKASFTYLNKCGSQKGTLRMQSFLDRYFIHDEQEAYELYVLAETYHLEESCRTIARQMQMRYLRETKNYTKSLEWCVRIKDVAFASLLANNLLNEYLSSDRKDINLLKLVHSFNIQIVFSERLVFISKYYEYFQLLNENKYLDACNLMISLLDVPKMISSIELKKCLILDLNDLLLKVSLNEEQLFLLLNIIQSIENWQTINKNENNNLESSIKNTNENDTQFKNIYTCLNAQLLARFTERPIQLA